MLPRYLMAKTESSHVLEQNLSSNFTWRWNRGCIFLHGYNFELSTYQKLSLLRSPKPVTNLIGLCQHQRTSRQMYARTSSLSSQNLKLEQISIRAPITSLAKSTNLLIVQFLLIPHRVIIHAPFTHITIRQIHCPLLQNEWNWSSSLNVVTLQVLPSFAHQEVTFRRGTGRLRSPTFGSSCKKLFTPNRRSLSR